MLCSFCCKSNASCAETLAGPSSIALILFCSAFNLFCSAFKEFSLAFNLSCSIFNSFSAFILVSNLSSAATFSGPSLILSILSCSAIFSFSLLSLELHLCSLSLHLCSLSLNLSSLSVNLCLLCSFSGPSSISSIAALSSSMAVLSSSIAARSSSIANLSSSIAARSSSKFLFLLLLFLLFLLDGLKSNKNPIIKDNKYIK